MLRSRVVCRVSYEASILTIVLLLSAPAVPWGQAAAKEPVSFVNEVAPILKESCFGCHNARSAKGKLDLTRYATLRQGGTKGDTIIVDGEPDASYLLQVLKAADNTRMPPKDTGDPLPPEKIVLIERWIREGAKLDTGLTAHADLQRELRLRWQPPVPPTVYRFPVPITALAFTPDNQKLVVGGHHELTVWDVNTRKLGKRIRTRARRTMALAFLPDGKLVAAGGRPGEEGEVRIYDIKGGKASLENGVTFLDGVQDKGVMLKHLLDANDEVLCLALSADGTMLASGGCDRLVNVWDIRQGWQHARRLGPPIENHADWVLDIAFSADGRHLVTASRDKTAKTWDVVAKGAKLTFSKHKNSVYGVALKADGKTCYSVGEDARLREWRAVAKLNINGGDETDGQDNLQIREVSQRKVALKVVLAPDQSWLATCGVDRAVQVWDTKDLGVKKTLNGHTDYVYALTISSDGRLIASGSYNGEVKVWKLPDDKPFQEFTASPGLQGSVAVPKK